MMAQLAGDEVAPLDADAHSHAERPTTISAMAAEARTVIDFAVVAGEIAAARQRRATLEVISRAAMVGLLASP